MNLVSARNVEGRRRTLRHKLRDEPVYARRPGSMGPVFHYDHSAVAEIMRRLRRCFRRRGGIERSRNQQRRHGGTYGLIKIFWDAAMSPFATGVLIHTDLEVAKVGAFGFAPNGCFRQSGYIFRADHREAHASVQRLVNRASYRQHGGSKNTPIVLVGTVDHVRELADYSGM